MCELSRGRIADQRVQRVERLEQGRDRAGLERLAARLPVGAGSLVIRSTEAWVLGERADWQPNHSELSRTIRLSALTGAIEDGFLDRGRDELPRHS